MKSLIGQYQRELKKFKSGTGDDEITKWFAFKKLMFLKDRCKSVISSDTGYEDKIGDTEKEQYESNEERDSSEKEIEFATPDISKIRKRSRPRQDQDNTSVEALSLLQNIYESRQQRDEFDVFGEHVAMKLRKLKNSFAKNTAQFHINNILYNADMGDYDWPSNSEQWSHRRKGVPGPSRLTNEDSTYRRRNMPGPSFNSESSNDGSVSTIEDIKCEILENQ